MGEREGRSRRRRWVLIALAVTLVVGGIVAKALWPEDRARSVEADDALDRFRASTTTESAAPPTADTSASTSTSQPVTGTPIGVTLPTPGVYRYHTVGTESVDILGGATHEFPEETLLTVTVDGCGVLLRWDLLVERREEWHLCLTDEGVEYQPAGFTYHEFFSNGRLEEWRCDQPLVVVPAGVPPVAPWADRIPLDCTIDGREWQPVWEMLEPETVVIDGDEVEVTRLRMTVVDTDEHYEQTVMEWWLDPTGLPVRMSMSKVSSTDSGVIGDVVYSENYLAELLSRTPLV